ncbi:Galactarate dehydratase (L-threo-forming) [bioreactor metagenome]|uniref:Galactarate dehydratase (L-threo-forming) n=1 Tax=bioreactor metagenome TaxID=1076179 RepID=A0A644YMC7_9ZZZZ
MERKIALKVHDQDNVATVFANGVMDGATVELRDKKGHRESLVVYGNIPYGHKIATRDIALMEPIVKYGEEIGVATRAVCRGEYVHVHNLDSMRGRGDLPARGEQDEL